jgi:hypothetical protein
MSVSEKAPKPKTRVTKRNKKQLIELDEPVGPVREADMTHWKKMWNDILSDPDFRESILIKKLIPEHHKYKYGDYQLFKLNTKQEITPKVDPSKKKGTFYMKFGGLGHYVAYEVKKDAIYIFDSSHGEHGRYADCLPPYIATIQKYFNENVEFVEKFGTLQVLPGDSFCQTWSLSYLLGTKTQNIMMKASTENKSEIEVLFELCKYIINLPVFKEICDHEKKWIAREFGNNKAPSKWTPEYFLNFSRERMDLESFRFLF